MAGSCFVEGQFPGSCISRNVCADKSCVLTALFDNTNPDQVENFFSGLGAHQVIAYGPAILRRLEDRFGAGFAEEVRTRLQNTGHLPKNLV